MASSDEAIGILRRYGSTYDLVVALYSYHVGVLMVYEADLGAGLWRRRASASPDR